MLDSTTILSQVRSGTAPSTWQVYRPSRSFFLQGAIGGVVLLIAAVAAAAYLLLSGTVVGYGVNDFSPDGVLTFWFAADLVVLLAFAIGGIVLVVGRLRSLGSIDDQVLVLMPEGYLTRTGPSEKQTTLVDFQLIAPVQLTISNGSVYLLSRQQTTGKTLKLEMDSRFGKPKVVAQQILALYGQFAHARAPQN
jgi:hypothetical protein